MTLAYALLASLLAASPAMSAQPAGAICLNPKWDYQAKWLGGNEIVAHQTFGRDQRPIKISTTCIGLERANYIHLSSDFHCIAQGDRVIATVIGDQRRSCRVTHVEPYSAPAP